MIGIILSKTRREEHLKNTAQGDCPRFTDGAKRSRRIGTVPDEYEITINC